MTPIDTQELRKLLEGGASSHGGCNCPQCRKYRVGFDIIEVFPALLSEIDRLKLAAVMAVVPLEALRASGKGGLPDDLWRAVIEGTDAVRAALEPNTDAS